MEISFDALAAALPPNVIEQNKTLKTMLISIISRYNQSVQEIKAYKDQPQINPPNTPTAKKEDEIFSQEIYKLKTENITLNEKLQTSQHQYEILHKDNEKQFQAIQALTQQNNTLNSQITLQTNSLQTPQYLPYNEIFNQKEDFEQLKSLAQKVSAENKILQAENFNLQQENAKFQHENQLNSAQITAENAKMREKITVYEEQLKVIQEVNSSESIEGFQSEIAFLKSKVGECAKEIEEVKNEALEAREKLVGKYEKQIRDAEQNCQLKLESYKKEAQELIYGQKQQYKSMVGELTEKNKFYLQEQLKDRELLFELKSDQTADKKKLEAEIQSYTTAKLRAKQRYDTVADQLESALAYIETLKEDNFGFQKQLAQTRRQLIEAETQNKVMRSSYDSVLNLPYQRQEIPLILRQIQLNSALQVSENLKHQELVSMLGSSNVGRVKVGITEIKNVSDVQQDENVQIVLNTGENDQIKTVTSVENLVNPVETKSQIAQNESLNSNDSVQLNVVDKYQIMLSDINDVSQDLNREFSYYIQISVLDKIFISDIQKITDQSCIVVQFQEKLQFLAPQQMDLSQQGFNVILYQNQGESVKEIYQTQENIESLLKQASQINFTMGKIEIEINKLD